VELWDLYTENREPTGEVHVRGKALPAERYHLVVHVWIKNQKGQYLISQRSASRPTFPLMWECVGGSVLKGEDSFQGALREVQEEVGIDLSRNMGRRLFTKVRGTIDGKTFNDIMDVWLFAYDGEANLAQATTPEVVQSRWMSPDEIRALYDSHQLVDSLSYFFEKVQNET
jgi:8-oxo-dGTP diphosphatase